MKTATMTVAVIAAALLSKEATGQVHQGVDLQVRFAPIAAVSGQLQILRYELHLTNFARDSLTLRRLQILDDATGREVAAISGDKLQKATRAVRLPPEGDTTVLVPGRLTLLYIDAVLPDVRNIERLRHRLHLSDGKLHFQVEGGRTKLNPAAPADFGPPLRGGPWVAVYEPSMDGGHRRFPYAVNGRATVPGRFAIDWFKVDAQGNHLSADGAPVLAVSDGEVVAARDDVPDPLAGSAAAKPALGDATGNYVVLTLRDGRFVFYEHLKKGLRVKRGQRVQRGQVIGFAGATGQVSGPHLHFHVADANSPLDAEGLPYGFRSFHRLGRYDSIAAYSRGGAWLPGGGISTGLPEPNAVMRFAD